MNLSKREFLQVLGAGTVAGMGLPANAQLDSQQAGERMYDVPRFGQVSLLHMTDCHAQLMPIHFREPSINMGIGSMYGKLPHLVGEHLLNVAKLPRGGPESYAMTYLDFESAAQRYGKVGGFAHLATLVKRLKASRPGSLLLDGGDTWQGSGTSYWTNGQDMVDACKLLGVDVMTAHWEFTLGMERVSEIIKKDFAGQVEFVAQNVKTTDFGDVVFKPYVMRDINGVSTAIIGQAFPYTPIANPRYMVADWEFGIQEEHLQTMIDEVRGKGAHVVVLLSHNGMDVDLKLASRVTGLDAILGGHTHDGMPIATLVNNKSGKTIVTNAGSNGKFLAVLDFEVKGKRVVDYRYKLLPVFANLLPADPAMQALVDKVRAPYAAQLAERLAVTEDTLYRRGNFNGSGDQLIVDALMAVQDAPIAFSPGFRWGTSLLPAQPITREWLMDMTATTYSYATVNTMTGATIKTVLEDVADNLFNPDPYYQQGGDMVRVGGLSFDIDPTAKMGSRIHNMRLKGELISADKAYKVASWAPVAEEARGQGLPQVWDVVEKWLKSQNGVVKKRRLNAPRIIGGLPNPGVVI
ncbi:MAG: thiosulfohydrolase SoxB [Betaproteobacteria bacterium]|jgi:S-sulfosulfanyl-L-cysteine sulfohydrolase|nr:thiosulfohydrolase SoxB [Betaproteobacteria bacterium]NBP45612.1 thiosulfohydrolase SoxB [Betaproteobacteria bacterium]